jgi:hypothetical protein
VGKLQRIALFTILGLIVLYACDYVVARLRPRGSVDVQIMWAIKQKDNRIDYELGDTETRPCVHSLFPQMGYAPCWYLSGHKNQTVTVGSIPRERLDTLRIRADFQQDCPHLFSAGAIPRPPRLR